MGMTADDYHLQMRQLLPFGPAFDPVNYPDFDALLKCLSVEFSRVDGRANDLFSELDINAVRETLDDWERVLGLPDECLGDGQSFEQRRATVIQREKAVGAQNKNYWLNLAKQMGYPNAEIIAYKAPRFGKARFGNDRFGTWAQQFFWCVKLGKSREGGRRWGVSVWGERFGDNPNEGIECVIKRWAHAHTVVIFEYE